MPPTYKHKQFGVAMIVGLIAAMSVIGAPLVGSLVPATLLGVCAVLFSTLTVFRDGRRFRIGTDQPAELLRAIEDKLSAAV